MLLEAFDAFRRPERLEPFLITCTADKRGRLQHEHDPYPQADFLRAARDAARAVTAQPFIEQGLTGTAIGEAMRLARIEAIAAIDRAAFQADG
jgi:tRNA nucleotidyltransferase (CCA-adding enzyme)